MNKVVLMGRLTKDPDVRYLENDNGTCFARYTLAVERRYNRGNEQTADFIPCIVFGKGAEVAERYFRKGTKLTVSGRIQTGSYRNRDGQMVYTTDVIVDEQEFAESKTNAQNNIVEQPAVVKEDPMEYADNFLDATEFEDDLPFS